MEKINLVELLKDCPRYIELDCSLFNNPVKYDGLDDNDVYPIKILAKNDTPFSLTKEGYLYDIPNSKCVIFPKGKTTWEGFVPPIQFRDGDIAATDCNCSESQLFIVSGGDSQKQMKCYVSLFEDGKLDVDAGNYYVTRYATEEEKQKLFKAIKDNGYKWNPETKTLEKIKPKFKPGDKIKSKNKKDEYFYILHVDEDKHKYVLNIKGYCLEFKDQDNYEVTNEPKFKVGDKVRHKNNHNIIFTITDIGDDTYVCGSTTAFWFDDQDDYELLPNKLVKPKFKVGDRIRQKGETSTFTITDVNDVYYFCGTYIICDTWDDDWELVTDKFDITTLKPFDKVLVRDSEEGRWDITFYELYDNTNKRWPHRTLGGNIYKYCIPYEDNEHLMGLVNDCDEYYKTWINEED